MPSGADWLSVGLTPRQGFARRYPRAMNLRGEILRDVVMDGTASEYARFAWDNWYREHYGQPVEEPLHRKEHLNPGPKQARDTTHVPYGAVER